MITKELKTLKKEMREKERQKLSKRMRESEVQKENENFRCKREREVEREKRWMARHKGIERKWKGCVYIRKEKRVQRIKIG
jgi:hypothetical protein